MQEAFAFTNINRNEAIARVATVLETARENGRIKLKELTNEELAEIVPLLDGLGFNIDGELQEKAHQAVTEGYVQTWLRDNEPNN